MNSISNNFSIGSSVLSSISIINYHKQSTKPTPFVFSHHNANANANANANNDKNLKQVDATLIDAPVLQQEIDELIHYDGEQALERSIKSLEADLSDKSIAQRLVESASTTESHIHYVELLKEAGKEIVSPEAFIFLDKVLPEEAMRRSNVQKHFDSSQAIFGIIGTFLHAINSGVSGTLLICRTKILVEAKKRAEELEKEATQANNQELLAFVKEWKANISIEEKRIAFSAARYLVVTAKNFFSNMEVLSKFLPANSFLVKNPFLLQAFGLATTGLSLALSAISLKTAYSDYKIQAKHMLSLKKTTPVFNPSIDDAINNKKLINQLLDKRKKTIDDNLSNHDKTDLLKKLKSFKRNEFEKDIKYLSSTSQKDSQVEEKDIPACLKTFTASDLSNLANDAKEDLFTSWFEDKHVVPGFNQWIESLKTRLEQDELKIQDVQIIMKDLEWPTIKTSTKIELIQSLNELSKILDADLSKKTDFIQKALNHHPYGVLKSVAIAYAESQSVISHSVKNSLKQLVAKKHEIEKKIIKFKLFESSALFSILGVSLAVTLTIVLLGLSMTPMGGLALLVLGSVAAVVGYSLMGVGYYMSYNKSPSLWKGSLLTSGIKFKISKIKAGIDEFSKRSKYKNLIKTAKKATELANQGKLCKNDQNYEKALKNYKKARHAYLAHCKKIDKWKEKLQILQDKLLDSSWQDFSKQAKLYETFDTLEALTEAIQAIDMECVDADTKSFFTAYLGVDLALAKEMIQKDPLLFKKALQNFSSFDDAKLVSFIRQRQAHIYANSR